MPKELITSSLVAPAFLGLNTQESSVANDPSFALEANNCVLDQYGRLGAREGWFYRTSGSDGVNLLRKVLVHSVHLLQLQQILYQQVNGKQ
jgi:hypothetical protein